LLGFDSLNMIHITMPVRVEEIKVNAFKNDLIESAIRMSARNVIAEIHVFYLHTPAQNTLYPYLVVKFYPHAQSVDEYRDENSPLKIFPVDESLDAQSSSAQTAYNTPTNHIHAL